MASLICCPPAVLSYPVQTNDADGDLEAWHGNFGYFMIENQSHEVDSLLSEKKFVTHSLLEDRFVTLEHL